MDVFDLQSDLGSGVTVTMSKRLTSRRAGMAERLSEIARHLAADTPHDPAAELRAQNQEMLRNLEALEIQRIEAVALSEELERTNKGVVALYAELDGKARELQELNTTLEQRVAAALAEHAQFEERLRHSQKMEAVGQLTGGVAHDFNNLLMVIGGSLELLRKRVPSEPAITRLLDAASQGVARGGSLNQQLLAFARKQDLREEVFCVNANTDAFQQLIDRAVSEDVSVRFVLADHLWYCRTDPHQLETAILNLSINARDAMPTGGVLTLSTANRHVDPAEAMKWDASAGEYVAVSVSDTGTGMSPELIARVFEPFFTTKEIGRGTGLGLSQVYGFAKQSGGFVAIESNVGQGTCVTIHLLRSQGELAAPQLPERSSDVVGGKASVLLVEDDAGVREIAYEMLSRSRLYRCGGGYRAGRLRPPRGEAF